MKSKINWTSYLPRIRRFDHHSVKELILKALLPSDWNSVAFLDHVEHEDFDLADGDLYDPEQNKLHQRGSIKGFAIEDGVLWPAVGALRTREGDLIAESFFNDTARRLCVKKRYMRRYPVIQVSGTVATLGHLYRNYYHRWSDSISRIYTLYHPFIRKLAPVRLCIDDRFSEDEVHVIRHLLPEYVELIMTDSTVRVQANHCIHLPFLSGDRMKPGKWLNASAGFIPQECLVWLRENVYNVLDVEPADPFRRLYVTRRYAKVRRLKNEKNVATYLQDRGFEVVALERLPLREQVKLFAEAHTVVAQHGAGLTNLLFGQTPRVLEICSDADRQVFFRLISESHGFAHVQIHREGTDKNDDVTLPIDQLEEGLSALEEASICISGSPSSAFP